jgi:hypothetical protein
MYLYSSEFLTGTSIPFKYTCDGENYSPPLRWEDPHASRQGKNVSPFEKILLEFSVTRSNNGRT